MYVANFPNLDLVWGEMIALIFFLWFIVWLFAKKTENNLKFNLFYKC